MADEVPIEDVLDEAVPGGREIVKELHQQSKSDEEIVAELQRRALTTMDGLLDLYNALGGSDGAT